MTDKIRKVLIGTPAHDGRVDVWYVNSLVNAIRIAQNKGIFLHPVFVSYDALVQRARNDTFSLAISGEYDDLIFIDSDMEFNPQWIMSLLEYDEDVVGGTARKKTDNAEIYVVNTDNLIPSENGLIKVNSLGTGFVKLSAKAIKAAWDASPEYQNEGKTCRMVCDVQIVDGQLHSEDTILFGKLKNAGFDIWLDPKMTCGHVGVKKFDGNFQDFAQRVLDYKAKQEAA